MAFNFEKSLERLSQIAQSMEKEGSSLEDSLKLYSEGIKLYAKCADYLSRSERKVEMLKNGKEILEKEGTEPHLSLFQDVEEED